MSEVTGYGIDLGGLNVKLKEAEDSLIRLKRVGTATAAAINKAFADASQGGIQQMRQSIDNMFSALSKDGGAQKSVEKIGEAVTSVGTQASKSATGIDALIHSIANGGAVYADLMQKINGTGFRSSSTKNSELIKVETQIEESKKKLTELKMYIDQFAKSDGLAEGARKEAAEVKNTIDMLERKRESLMANIRLQERATAISQQSVSAKSSSQEYVAIYERAIKEYTQLWEQADKKVAKQKVAEYKATIAEIMELDKSMYSTNKAGIGSTEDAKVVEARHKELMQKKLALENEIDDLIARNKLNKEDKLARDVENIQAKSGAKTSAERQRRVAQEADEERREKIAQYKATLAEMKTLDSKIHYVNTRGTDAEKAAMAETRARFEELKREKTRLETELGTSVNRIRNKFENEFQSEEGRRAVQTRIMKENEAKKAANEAKRLAKEKAREEEKIEKDSLRQYSSLMRQKFSLTGDIEKLSRKTGLSDADKARIEELKRKEQELNREIASLSVQLGHKKDSIDREYQNKVLQRTAKRCVQESEIELRESQKTRNQVRKEYEKTIRDMEALLKKSKKTEGLGGALSSDSKVSGAHIEYMKQLNNLDAKKRILESSFSEWLADLQRKQTTKHLDEEINAIKKRQADEKAAIEANSRARQQEYQKYVTSYDGAIRKSDKAIDRGLNEEEQKKAIENLIAARQKLSTTEEEDKKKREEINKRINEHIRILKEAAMTEQQKADQAEKDADRQVKAQERINREKEKEARSAKPVSQLLATDTTNMTLRELQNYSASIKATMANLQPRSTEWNQLNAVLQTTNNRINGIKREMGLLRTSTKDASDAMANLGRFMNIAFVTQRLWSFTNSVVKLTGEFEQMQVALKVIVGSLEASNKIWEQTVELASKSPFKATELIKYTRQLAAYRIETSKLHDTTKMLADVSAGLGVDMSRLILAYGQVRAAEYLRGTELRQFTEAGVPMLEELAKHFTELNGKATTTAEVFEMISKRQVAFADVSAVLENMTSEGGPFYKMQEQLANTIKGNIATLKNEVDLMMHEIGQSSSWAITGFLKILKLLVKNWEYVSIILSTVLGLYLGYQVAALKVAISSGKVAAAVAGEAVALTGLAGAYAKAKMAMQAFNATMMTTPIGWIIAAIAALISIISVVASKMSAARKAREERAKEIEDEMRRISEAYEGMRDRVESALSVFDDAESSSKDAEIALYKLIDIAKDEYHMTFVVDVEGKSKEQLEEEARNIATQTLAAGEDAESLEKKWEETWSTMLVTYDDYVMKLNKIGEKTITVNGEEIAQAVYETYAKKSGTQEAELQDLQKSVTDYYNRIKETIKKESTDAQNLANLQKSPVEILQEYLGRKQNKTFEEEEMYSAVLAIEETYNTIADQIISSDFLSSDKGDAINLFLNRLKEGTLLTAEQIKDLEDILEGKLGGDLEVVDKGLTDFQQKFNTFLAKVQDASLAGIDSKAINEMGDKYKKLVNGKRSNDLARFFEAISPGSTVTQEQLAKQVKEELDKWKAIKNAYEEAIAKGMESIYTKGDYEIALKGIEFLDPVNVFLGNTDSNKGSGKNKLEDANKKRIDLLKKMNQQYINEFKTFGDEAEPEIRAAYEKAFGEVFKGTKIDMSQIDFTSKSGMVESLEKLRPLAKKAGKDAVEALETEIAKFKSEIKIEAQKDEYQKTLDDVQRLFNQYELTLELKKLNVPPELAKTLFGEDFLSFDQLKSKTKSEFIGDVDNEEKVKVLTEQLNKGLESIDWNIVDGILGPDQAKELKKRLEQLDNMEDKLTRDRMAKYVQYSRDSLGEMAKIRMEQIQKISEIEEAFMPNKGDSPEASKMKAEEKDRALAKAKSDADEALAKLEWENFRKSETFTSLMDDLSGASDNMLKQAIEDLEAFKKQWEDLPIDQMQEVVKLINKAKRAQDTKDSPWAEAKRLRGNITADGRTREQAELDSYNAEVENMRLQEELQMITLIQQQRNAGATNAQIELAIGEKYAHLLKEEVNLTDRISKINEKMGKNRAKIDNAQGRIQDEKDLVKQYNKQKDVLDEINNQAQKVYDSFKSLYEAVGGDGEDAVATFADMGMQMASAVLQTISLQIGLKAVETGAYAAGTALNTAMGVIGWIVMAVQLLVAAFTAITKYNDKKWEKIIEEQTKKVEILQKQYEQLEEAIDGAWNFRDIQDYNEEMMALTESMIMAQKAAIAARKQQKDYKKGKSDAIDEVMQMEDELAELEKQLNESIKDSFSKVTDGILDDVFDAAKGFTDAWYEAFKETGDGLSGLEENFEEMFMNLAKNQASGLITGKFVEQWKDALGYYINEKDTTLTAEEAASWAAEVKESLPELNAALEAFLGTISSSLSESGSLSELQKGIQGVTEETAQVLEALLNSMRLYVADTNNEIKNQTKYIEKMWRMMDNAVSGLNPFYVQMKTI